MSFLVLIGGLLALASHAVGDTREAHVIFQTSFGPIPVSLLNQNNAPGASQALLDLARSHGTGTFDRAEPRPPPDRRLGPPYALLQGSFGDNALSLAREGTKTTIAPGDLVLIPNTNSFYIALESHDDWASSHSVVGQATAMTIVDVIVAQHTFLFQHPDYGTHMQMLTDPVPFRLTDDISNMSMLRPLPLD
jgi:hypothetical protein